MDQNTLLYMVSVRMIMMICGCFIRFGDVLKKARNEFLWSFFVRGMSSTYVGQSQ